ncbi:hypothetical protein [Endozoicomonas ascidiicola]|uniref:hypothetical protein n=1 Tax=Endozoicomonas ascidiicola TaxID=1698521 RepID=UPI0008345796|nr:hypothetical protein [Endozoicomonas ascidiicola]
MFNKSLKQILSSFEKTITELDTLITRNSEKVDVNSAVIRDRQSENSRLIVQSHQARSVSDKLRDLIGEA